MKNEEGIEMQHVCDLAERIGDLLFDDKTSDMTFVVEGERLPGHRAILTTSSEYFRALLQGNMKESLQKQVVLKDVPLRGFRLLMSYVYTGQLKLDELEDEVILEVLGIIHLYGFEKLQAVVCKYLGKNLSIKNACTIYNKAHFLGLKELGEACYQLIVEDPSTILKTEAFCDLSEPALCHMLTWDTFCAEEIEIFEAVLRWRAKQSAETNMSRILEAIRLALIDTTHLVTTVKDSGLFMTDVVLDAVRMKKCNAADLKFRGSLKEGANLADKECGAMKLTAKLRGDYEAAKASIGYDGVQMPSQPASIELYAGTGLTVALGKPFFVNHIAFDFLGDSVEFSYYVEVSMDRKVWVRVIDHAEYPCRRFQNLYFEPRVVRYIKLIGAWYDLSNIWNLEVAHVNTPFTLACGFYAPKENVASKDLGARVIESDDESEGLIEEEISDDEEESRWTSHEIGKNVIMIQLSQPYTVDTMKILLRSNEERAYLYFIATSMDKKTWTRVADHTTDLCRSWQTMLFEARPVLFIKIVGTASTADKNFSCARFECFAQGRSNTAASPGNKVKSGDAKVA